MFLRLFGNCMQQTATRPAYSNNPSNVSGSANSSPRTSARSLVFFRRGSLGDALVTRRPSDDSVDFLEEDQLAAVRGLPFICDDIRSNEQFNITIDLRPIICTVHATFLANPTERLTIEADLSKCTLIRIPAYYTAQSCSKFKIIHNTMTPENFALLIDHMHRELARPDRRTTQFSNFGF